MTNEKIEIMEIGEDLQMRHYKRMLGFLKADAEGRTEVESKIVLEQVIAAAQELLKEHHK